jgi:hypothetical protein
MGIGGGERILINDKLNADSPNRATAINVITDQGFKGVEWKF